MYSIIEGVTIVTIKWLFQNLTFARRRNYCTRLNPTCQCNMTLCEHLNQHCRKSPDILKYSGHNALHTAKQSKSLRLMTASCAVLNPMHLVLIFPTICIPHIFSVHYVTLDITQSPHLRLFPERVLASPHPLWYQGIAQTPAAWTVWSLPFISN